MKKVPLHTIIFFVLALIPAVMFAILLIIGVITGYLEGIIWLILFVLCEILEISVGVLVVLALGLLVFQIVAVVNFIRIRKKVREYNENHTDEE